MTLLQATLAVTLFFVTIIGVYSLLNWVEDLFGVRYAIGLSLVGLVFGVYLLSNIK